MDRTIRTLWHEAALSRAVGMHARHSVLAAVRSMNEHHTGSVLVFDGPRLIGILTERDVLSRVIETQRAPARTPVIEAMTSELHTIAPDATVEDAHALMQRESVSHLPVIDRGTVLGVISLRDVMRLSVSELRVENHDLHQYIHGPFADVVGST